MARRVRKGGARQLCDDPPIWLLPDLVSQDEAAAMREIQERRQRDHELRAGHARVCFQHDSYSGHPGLRVRRRQLWSSITARPADRSAALLRLIGRLEGPCNVLPCSATSSAHAIAPHVLYARTCRAPLSG